jgi:amino acid transporter
VALALFTVGYAAMSRHVWNAGAFYAYISVGLGRLWGVAASFVALFSYSALQVGLYGLFGAALSGFLSAQFAVDLPWWLCSAYAIAVVGALGVLRVDLNARLLAVLLTLECAAVVIYDVVALAHPAGGVIHTDALSPAELVAPSAGGVLAFCIAAFVGIESGAIYSEECRDPRRTVGRATFAALAFTGVLYAFSAWAMTVTVGPDRVVEAAAEAGPGVVFATIDEHWSPVLADLAHVVFLTSVFAAALSFHNGVARYLFALGRERLLPGALSRVGASNEAPVAGSLTQSAVGALIVAAVAAARGDPLEELFTWSSGLCAIGIVLLMTATSMAVIGYFHRRRPEGGRPEVGRWQRLVAPALATVVLAALAVKAVDDFDTLLGESATTPLRWLLPGLVGAVAAAGLIRGLRR